MQMVILTYAIASNPSNGSVTLNSVSAGTFTYSPTANYNGTDTFTFTVNDGTVTSSAATVTMTITAVNDNPVASAVSATTDEDTDVSGSLSGADVDGDVLTYTIVNNPTKGSVQVVSDKYLNFDGSDDYVEIENQSLETSVFDENISFSAKVLVTGGENTNRNILTNAQMSGDGYVFLSQPIIVSNL